jgi:hypothetical protein
MAMFTAYFDASGHPKDHPFVIVSGYVANYIQWTRFEEEWEAAHNHFGVTLPFHMAEFNSACSKSHYATQSNARPDYVAIAQTPDRADAFLKHLSQLQISFALLAVSCIVNMQTYTQINSVLNLQETLPPFALGARMCIQKIRNWENNYAIRQPVECIFEQGDFGQGQFTKLMVDEGEDVPIYKKKAAFAGLQAADMYAWEQFNFLRREHLGTVDIPRKPFYYLLESIPKLHTSPDAVFLLNLCEQKGISSRL